MIKLIQFVIFFFLIFSKAAAYNRQTDSLIVELAKANSDTLKIKILNKLSSNLQINKDSTLNFVKQSVEISEKTNSNEWITRSQIAYGMWYLGNSKSIDSSVIIWHKLYDRMEVAKYVKGMAQAYRYLGKAYLLNSVDSSIYYNVKSIELFQSIHDSDQVNSVKINLAAVYAQSGRFDEGIKLTKEGLAYSERKGNIPDAGTAAVNIGVFYRETGELDSAIVYFKKSGYFNSLRNEPVGVAHSRARIADVLTLQKKYDEAKSNYTDVLKTGRSLNSDRLVNYAFEGFAAIALAKNNWDAAIIALDSSFHYSDKTKADEAIYYEGLYKAYKGLANYKKALEYFILFSASRDSFNNAERLNKMDELEAQYQNKEKQTKIDLLNKEKQIQEEVASRQLLIRNAIIGFSLLVLMTGALLFNRFKLKKKIEKQLILLNERKRISSELHDDLGAQLSTARMFLNHLKENSTKDNNQEIIANSLQMIESSISDLRKIMDDLQSTTLEEKGYIAATEELVNKINILQQINFTLTHHEIHSRLEKKTEHHLFRITQELINNTLRYAKAKNVSIDLVKRENKIVLLFEDNGSGFDPGKIKRGRGLSNIENRIKSLDGNVEFDTSPGAGFRAIIEIPVYVREKI